MHTGAPPGAYPGPGGVRQRSGVGQEYTYPPSELRQNPGKTRVGFVRRVRAFMCPDSGVFAGWNETRKLKRDKVLLTCLVALLVVGAGAWAAFGGPGTDDGDNPVVREYAAMPRALVAWTEAVASGVGLEPVANVTSGMAAKEVKVEPDGAWYATRDVFGSLVAVAWAHDLVVANAFQLGVPLSAWVVRIPPDADVDGIKEVSLTAHEVQRLLRRTNEDDAPDTSVASGVPAVHLASPEVVGPDADGAAEAHGHTHRRPRRGLGGDAAEPHAPRGTEAEVEAEKQRVAEAHAAAAATRYLLLFNLKCEPHATAMMGILVATQTGTHGSTMCPGVSREQELPHDVLCTGSVFSDDASVFGLHDVTFTAAGEVAATLWYMQEEAYVRPHVSLCAQALATGGCTAPDAGCAPI